MLSTIMQALDTSIANVALPLRLLAEFSPDDVGHAMRGAADLAVAQTSQTTQRDRCPYRDGMKAQANCAK
jgi:hypothetical protein